jgi:hypothetical protein
MPEFYPNVPFTGGESPYRGYWHPGPEVTHFNGTPLAGDLDFFVLPPREIGTILYAHSTLRRGKMPWNPVARLFLAVMCGLIGGVLGLVVFAAMAVPGVAVVPALIGMWVGWFATRFKHRCYYVGTTGCAYFQCGGNRESLIVSDVFLFRPGLRCDATTTARYENNVYMSTSYNVSWEDSQGRVLYRIQGSHSSKNNTPSLDDDFWYALAAYAAWDYYEKLVFAVSVMNSLNLHRDNGSA